MLPDAPRTDILDRLRRLAAVLLEGTPTTVPTEFPVTFKTVAVLLLARIAGQGRTVATLIGRRHELDAQIVMRSMLEHLTLLAWLSIEPSGTGGSAGRNRDQKALWWVADQCRRDERLQQRLHVFIAEADAARWAEVRDAKACLKEQWEWGSLPKLERMAQAVDAAWGGRLDGWPKTPPRDPAYGLTVHGMYVLLYSAGSQSTHPSLGQLTRAFLEATDDACVGHVTAEPLTARVNPIVSICTYLMLYAAAVSEHVHGGSVLDQALRILDRFDVVRGPRLLLERVTAILGGVEGRRFGMSDGLLIRLEHVAGKTTVVLASSSRGWERMIHEPGPQWTWDAEDQSAVQVGAADFDDAMAHRMCRFRECLETPRWSRDPEVWPLGIP